MLWLTFAVFYSYATSILPIYSIAWTLVVLERSADAVIKPLNSL